jgi:tetraacyldisaccharide 4'-kinase
LTGCDTVVSRDRVAGARKLVAMGVDVVIADDGLQHLRLARECEIVVIDGARGFGNGRLLPAGPLREPPSRLRESEIVVVNGAAEHASLRGRTTEAVPAAPGALPSHPAATGVGANNALREAFHMTLFGDDAHRLDGLASPRPLEHFRGQRVHAVAGIGNPNRFFRNLRALGLEVIEHPFADHHPFVAADLTFDDALPVLMTEKDAVKCRSLATPRLWFVPVVARFGEPLGQQLLDRVVARLRP